MAERGSVGLRSPVSWALLGLVIQRPSYGYELVHRFERTYGDALELSSSSQIYNALDALVRRGLIETMPAHAAEPGERQPKPHYRATAQGARGYEEWLVGQIQQELRRSCLFAQQLAALAPPAALRVLERCEQGFLDKASAHQPRHRGAQDRGDGHEAEDEEGGLSARLIAEEDRLAIGARLAWIEYARRELRTPTSGRGQRR